jgi:formate C-acetyltransferase
MVTRLFNGSGAIGQLDELLQPFYERDSQAGVLTDAEAVFHLACMFLIDTQYYQIGGPSADGQDRTSPISFLILEALHQARIPSNVTVRVWDGLDPELFDRAVDYLCRDRNGSPRFMGEDGMTEGFMRNGYPRALARERVTCGCHWAAIPGREYTLNDIVKINFGAVFTAALQDLRRLPADAWTTPQLWDLYCEHLEQGIACVKQGIDHHLRLMYRVTPEIPLNLLCHGTIERGRDVTHGGVDHYNMCIDGAALATVADSFAALETFVEREGTLTWPRMFELLDTDFRDDEPTRQMLRNMPRFGHGGSAADRYAERLVERFVHEVKKGPTPDGFNCIPGLFSWANTVPMGRVLPATPNGRHAGAPISHGANPDPGFRRDGAATALFNALLQVQCRWGNTVPIQVELDPGMARPGETRERLKALIQTYCRQGGTLLNINILNRDQVLEAHRDPDTHPDLVVRVTGFSAYFRLLSPEFRQLVVDRIMAE